MINPVINSIDVKMARLVNILLCLVILGSIHDSFGMFECIITQFEPIVKNSPVLNLDKIKIIRFNRTTLVSNGTFQIYVEGNVVKEVDILCNSYKKAGNEYRLTPYKHHRTNLCKGLSEDEFFYPAFHANTNLPPLGTCDFKSGFTYFIKNYLPDLSKVPPVFQSGDYMLECKLYRGEEFLQGFQTYGQVYNIASSG